MPKGMQKALGVLLLMGTIGLSTCQSLLEAQPNAQTHLETRAHPSKSKKLSGNRRCWLPRFQNKPIFRPLLLNLVK